MVVMNDTLFSKISLLLNNDFDKKNRNRIYYLMRKDIFGCYKKVKFVVIINNISMTSGTLRLWSG